MVAKDLQKALFNPIRVGLPTLSCRSAGVSVLPLSQTPKLARDVTQCGRYYLPCWEEG